MRKTLFAVALLALSVFTVGEGRAQSCNNPPVGPYIVGPFPPYWDYTQNHLDSNDTSCWTFSAAAAPAPLVACGGQPGWEIGRGFSTTITQSYVVPSTGGTRNTNWIVQFELDFDDPNADWYTHIRANISVRDGATGQLTTNSQYYSHNGTQGSVPCQTQYATFQAKDGDTITMRFQGGGFYNNSRVRISRVNLLRY